MTASLSTAAAYAASRPLPLSSTPAVRILSLPNALNLNTDYESPILSLTPTTKILHLIRHAEGTHNISPDHKTPAHLDATLTPRGVDQCRQLSRYAKNLEVDAVLVSPMTRCLETARLSFPHLYGEQDDDRGDCNREDKNATNNYDSYPSLGENNNQHKSGSTNYGDNHFDRNNNKNEPKIPFIAHEEWRETVNYLCDSRRPLTALRSLYPCVDFSPCIHDHDPLWEKYQQIHGCHETHTKLRESNDPQGLLERAHKAWKVVLERPERRLALVGHSAFFMHMFTPLFEELEGVVRYEDEEVEELMRGKGRFENCELRSVLVDFPL